jgi:hypothetical protein
MPKSFSARVVAWVNANQGQHLCGCGCGEAVPVKPWHCWRGIPKCVHGHNLNAHRPVAERFWRYVEKTDGCWLWTGCLNRTGYGVITVRAGLHIEAHRLSWEIHRGPIPEGLEVCHHCPAGDRPNCVNPDHLWLGTHEDNMRDRSTKGRWRRLGLQNSGEPLDEETARRVREARSGGQSERAVARAFGLSRWAVRVICEGRTWRVVT